MRHPKTAPDTNGVRLPSQAEPGWVLALISLAVVMLACGGSTL